MHGAIDSRGPGKAVNQKADRLALAAVLPARAIGDICREVHTAREHGSRNMTASKWIMSIALAAVPIFAHAQTYSFFLRLDGETYKGDFTFTPSYTTNSGGQTVEIGSYSNVSISDPYAGTLTSGFDVYDGNNSLEHELWFSSGKPYGTIGINIPYSPGGPSVPVTGALVYIGDGSLDYETCTKCDARITEVRSRHPAPEIDASSSASSLALLLGGAAVLRGRRKVSFGVGAA
jgi:hypothetical protein